MKKRTYVLLLILFFVFVGAFAAVHFLSLPLRSVAVTLPVLYLSIITFIFAKGPAVWLPIGLFLSAAGDFMGGQGEFIMQLSFFALAHISYMIYFFRGGWLRPLSIWLSLMLIAVVVAFCFWFVPDITNSTEKIFVIIYAVLITLMGVSAMFWKGPGKWTYITGALLFIVSDGVIAWSRFVSPFIMSGVVVMTTYYSAQFLFAATFLHGYIRRGLFD